MPSISSSQIKQWPIERLVEYPRNPRRSDGAVERTCDSIREFGFKIPVLARSDGEIVDGHLRLKAARKLGITEIPLILCDEWTPAQVKAFRLMVIRRELDAALDPYRGKMSQEQIAMLERQYFERRVFELFDLPRLSLFYLRPPSRAAA